MQKYLYIFFLALALVSCKTTERTSHKTVEHLSDSLAQQSNQERSISDSLSYTHLKQWWKEQYSLLQQQQQQQEQEQIVEEITTVTDTTGTITRNEKRTTTRTASSNRSQQSTSYQQDYGWLTDSLAHRLDLLEEQHGAMFKATKHDNFSEDRHKTSTPSIKTSLGWSLGVTLAIVIIAAVVLLYLRVKNKISFK